MFDLPHAATVHDPALFWSLAALCAVCIAVAKTGIPGIGILVVGVMANIFNAQESSGALLPLLVAGDVFTVVYYRGHAVFRHVTRALPWALAGIVAGWAFQRYCPLGDLGMRRVIGGIVLGVLALGAAVNREGSLARVPHSWAFAALVGVLGGFATMTANAAGPVWIVYLLALGLPKESFLATSGWLCFILNSAKLPFSHNLGLITWDSLLFNAKMLPLIALGAALGKFLAGRIPESAFGTLVKLLTLASAVRLLL